jgi:dTDP-4-dehydrorhamnose 3,5-epimerase
MSGSVRLIEGRRFEDSRGWFQETYNAQSWGARGVDAVFVQDNQSYSRAAGTIRGIHFQNPPSGQGKLVRCTRGSIMDYAVDLRAGSPTYGQHVGYELSASNGRQLWVPVGYGHAFVTLEPDTEVAYKVTALYDPATDGGIRWDDADIAIDWPLPPEGPTLSDKDAVLPRLAEFESRFVYDGSAMMAG